MQHLRSVEWKDYFRDRERSEEEEALLLESLKIPSKLKVKKHSRPPWDALSDKQKAYSEYILSGMREFDQWGTIMKSNLNRDEKRALTQLKRLCNDKIMIGPTDKDQRIVICDLADYKRRVQIEVEKNFEVSSG